VGDLEFEWLDGSVVVRSRIDASAIGTEYDEEALSYTVARVESAVAHQDWVGLAAKHLDVRGWGLNGSRLRLTSSKDVRYDT
jgi:hypothetical protein